MTKKPLKIMILSLAYYPNYIGGAEVAIKEITDRVSDIEFHMITLGESRQIGNIKIFGILGKLNFINKILYPFISFIKLSLLNKKNNYDLIWPMMASYAGFSAMLFKAFNKNSKVLLTIQEGENFERRKGIFYPFFREIFESADYIQVISNFLKTWSIEMGASCPIEVIPNGVDIKYFSNKISDTELNDLKFKLNKRDEDVFLITTSRLVNKNAVEDIISSLQFLPSNIKLLILGDGELKNKLIDQVSKMKLNNRVSFLGHIDRKELPKYLQISDIFVRPSISEGFGISYIEAMACNIPVIATQVGGIVDFIKDRETGIFCQVNNPKDISDKVKELVENTQLKNTIIENAFNLVKNKYDWSKVSNDMKDLFIKVSSK